MSRREVWDSSSSWESGAVVRPRRVVATTADEHIREAVRVIRDEVRCAALEGPDLAIRRDRRGIAVDRPLLACGTKRDALDEAGGSIVDVDVLDSVRVLRDQGRPAREPDVATVGG